MSYQVVFHFLRQYRLLYGGILVVTLIASALESLSLAAFFPVFTSVLDDSTEGVGGILGVITSIAERFPFDDPIISASVLLVSLFVAKTIFTMAREGLIAYSSGKVLYDTKNRIMEKYAGSDYQFFLDNKQGSMIYSGLQAPHHMAHVLLRFSQMVGELFRTIAIIIVLLFVSPFATIALAILALGYSGVIHDLSKRMSYRFGQRRASALAEQTVIANEFFTGIRQIIAYCSGGSWLERFRKENRVSSEMYAKDLAWVAMPKSIMELAGVALMMGLVLLLWFVTADTFADALPRLGVFAVALIQLLPSITNFGRMRMQIMGAMPDTELVYNTLTGPAPTRVDGNKNVDSFEKAIAFEDVSFAYKGRDTLLDRVDMVFEKGKTTALVGPSGAGKTTIINLILGLFEPTNGRITLDGVSLGEYKLASWLGKIGFVSQEPFIYNSTVAANITFTRNGHSMESIITAASIANAHGLISDLPQGYDTIVGDRGMKLSGGQQQRIAIARAVLDQPELLIFDEATSSLDTLSEKLVQEAIENVSKDRTVIIIAHRLSTIRYADKIIVMDSGRVIEEGTHDELLSQQGHYSRLVASST